MCVCMCVLDCDGLWPHVWLNVKSLDTTRYTTLSNLTFCESIPMETTPAMETTPSWAYLHGDYIVWCMSLLHLHGDHIVVNPSPWRPLCESLHRDQRWQQLWLWPTCGYLQAPIKAYPALQKWVQTYQSVNRTSITCSSNTQNLYYM